jgi:hypothetical protein
MQAADNPHLLHDCYNQAILHAVCLTSAEVSSFRANFADCMRAPRRNPVCLISSLPWVKDHNSPDISCARKRCSSNSRPRVHGMDETLRDPQRSRRPRPRKAPLTGPAGTLNTQHLLHDCYRRTSWLVIASMRHLFFYYHSWRAAHEGPATCAYTSAAV